MADELDQQITQMAEWLQDPRNAEPCETFPADPERASTPGMYAWHGDELANELIVSMLGKSPVHPLYAGQAGATSSLVERASGATLKSRIVGNHLRGNTRASTFRRTLASLLWDELALSCVRPKTLDADSNTRLTEWMLEHLSVTTAPVADGSRLGKIEEGILDLLDPPLNLSKVARTDGRTKLRVLRSAHLGAKRAG